MSADGRAIYIRVTHARGLASIFVGDVLSDSEYKGIDVVRHRMGSADSKDACNAFVGQAGGVGELAAF